MEARELQSPAQHLSLTVWWQWEAHLGSPQAHTVNTKKKAVD